MPGPLDIYEEGYVAPLVPGAQRPATPGEAFTANRTLQAVDNSDYLDTLYDEEFEGVLEAVNDHRRRRGLNPMPRPSRRDTAFLGMAGLTTNALADVLGWLTQQPGTARDNIGQAILDEAARIRREDPAFLPGVAGKVSDLLAPRLAAEKEKRQRAAYVAQGAEGVLGTVAGFSGGVTMAMQDPVNIATLPIGGFGRHVATRLLTEGLSQALVELALLPQAAENREALGEELTGGEALLMMTYAAVGGAAFRGILEGAAYGGRALAERMRPLDEKLARALAGAEPTPATQFEALASVLAKEDPELLGDVLRAARGGEDGPGGLTPEESAALGVLSRSAEIDAANPFAPSGDGRAQFEDDLTRAIDGVLNGEALARPAPKPPLEAGVSRAAVAAAQAAPRGIQAAGAPGEVAAVLGGEGWSDAVTAGFLGNFEIEGGYGGARGDGGSASGIAQWRHERRANFRRMFGKEPHQASAAEQARFVVWEMDNPRQAFVRKDGLSPEQQRDAILAARTPEEAAELIDRYYERSSGEHRDRRREAARRIHGGEPGAPVARGGGEGDDLRAQADALRAEAAGLEAERTRGPERFDPQALDPDMPVLKRELFPDDNSWRVAQAAIEAERLDLPEPRVTRQSTWDAARAKLTEEKGGEAPGALYHPEIGPIAVRWGDARGGLSQLVARHADILDQLPELIETAEITRLGATMLNLRPRGKALALRLDFDADNQRWTLAAASKHKGAKPPPASAKAEPAAPPVEPAAEPPGWLTWLSQQVGTSDWIVAPVLTPALRRQGFRRALSQEEFAALSRQYEELHGSGPEVDVSPLDPQAEAAMARFDVPAGDGQAAQADSLGHDARLAVETEERTLARPARGPGFGEDAPLIATFSTPKAKKGERPVKANARLRAHPDYRAAKAGDLAAAQRLVEQLADPATIEQVARAYPGARFVAVTSPGKADGNAIPLALAARYARATGGAVDGEIVQVRKVGHTGSSAHYRFATRAEFDGPVEAGASYVLVDDVLTMGGTLAELASHIAANGGQVKAAVVLASESRAGRLAPTAAETERLRTVHGELLDELGLDARALTGDEARYLLGFRSTDAARDRIAAAREAQDGGGAEPRAGRSARAERVREGGEPFVAAPANPFDPAVFAALGGERTFVVGGEERSLRDIIDRHEAQATSLERIRQCL